MSYIFVEQIMEGMYMYHRLNNLNNDSNENQGIH